MTSARSQNLPKPSGNTTICCLTIWQDVARKLCYTLLGISPRSCERKEVAMPKTVDLADVLQKNPHIDPAKLEENLRLAEELRRRGVIRRSYELVPPFGGRRVQVVEDSSEDDPRTVH